MEEIDNHFLVVNLHFFKEIEQFERWKQLKKFTISDNKTGQNLLHCYRLSFK